MVIKKDLTGKKFGKLTVISFSRRNKNGTNYWICKCECGKEKEIVQSSLTGLHTTSCGCAQKERRKKFWNISQKKKEDNYIKGKLLQSKSIFYYV